MKKIFFLSLFFLAALGVRAQDFGKQVAAARTAYTAGKLDDARMAMQQALQELDLIMGKEVLKLLPPKMGELSANTASDNVSGASNFLGVLVNREYGKEAGKVVDLSIISNSPYIATLNSLLSIPLIGNSGDSKVVRIAGYKGLLQKSEGENGKVDYEVQLPVNSTLITLRAPGYTEDQVVKFANTIPVDQIAKLMQ